MDFLKPIFDDKALTYDQFAEKLAAAKDIKLANLAGGGYVVREKLTAKESEIEDLKKQLESANKQIAEFKGMDIEGIRKAADDYKSKFEKAQKDAEEKAQAMQFDFALTNALAGAKAKNAKAVKALLDLDSLKLNGEEIVGLKEQIEKVRAENSYLFESDKKAPEVVRPTGGVAPTQTTEEAFGKMGYMARLALKKSNPNLYQELTKKEQ